MLPFVCPTPFPSDPPTLTPQTPPRTLQRVQLVIDCVCLASAVVVDAYEAHAIIREVVAFPRMS